MYLLKKECEGCYDQTFANEFEEYLSKGESALNKESSNDSYLQYIEYHLKSKKCQLFCSQLWLVQSILSLCQYLIL